jgi:hypothetical protein
VVYKRIPLDMASWSWLDWNKIGWEESVIKIRKHHQVTGLFFTHQKKS